MHELQDKLASLPILSLQNADGRYTLETSTRNVQSECVLLQEQLD